MRKELAGSGTEMSERADTQGACLQATDAYGKTKGVGLLALATEWRTETSLLAVLQETKGVAALPGIGTVKSMGRRG
jgi:hypothetical protein